jgi:hypothetical protein
LGDREYANGINGLIIVFDPDRHRDSSVYQKERRRQSFD